MLVFGSLPPEGRDLDLLARPDEERTLAAALERTGFARRGAVWAEFRDCTAFGIELVPAASWRLPDDELERLYVEAAPLEGTRNLVAPAPHHALLIRARRSGGRVGEKERLRIDRALALDAGAWDRARSRAAAWGAERELAALRRAYERGSSRASIPYARHVRALARGGNVVALSGLDGAGKSSQAQALRRALEQLGIPAVVIWTPFASNAFLRALAAPVKRILGRARAPGGGPASLVARPGTERAGTGPARAVVAHAWASVVAATNGVAHRRAALPHLLRGRVVIFDRYTLDSAVHLRYLYGEARPFGFQNALIGALSPKPLRSYFLDVEAETVVARKPIQYELAAVRRQSRLYREECAKRRVTRLDGERTPDELAAEIAADVWTAL